MRRDVLEWLSVGLQAGGIGVLVEQAMGLSPPPDEAEIEQALRHALQTDRLGEQELQVLARALDGAEPELPSLSALRARCEAERSPEVDAQRQELASLARSRQAIEAALDGAQRNVR